MTDHADKREPLSADELEYMRSWHAGEQFGYERDGDREVLRLLAEHAAQRERIAELERERDQARAEVERLDGRRREMRQLLARLVKYATEDRAVTPGFTRLARCVAQVSDYLARTSEPADVLRSAPAPQPPAELLPASTPKREPVAVEPRADAPLEVAALAHWWDEQRRREGKSHLSYCAAELRRARDAEIEALRSEVSRRTFPCRQCGGPCEPERYAYATPVCFACLPPPKPLPVREITKGPKP